VAAFGEELRRARRRAGISQDVLAKRINFDKSYVSRVENLRQSPSRTLAQRCDDALGANGDLVTSYEQEKSGRRAYAKEAVAFHDVKRRSFLGLGAAATAGLAGLAGIDLSGDRVDVGPAEVAQLNKLIDRLHALDLRHGAADLWDLAAARAQGIAALLERAEYADDVGEALVKLAGRAYICAGWFATDAGQHEAAHRFYTEALALAGQAESPETTVHALANLGLHAQILRRPRQVLRYVAAAEKALPKKPPLGRAPAMLLTRRARCLATLGQPQEARKAFVAARHALDRDADHPPMWLEFFTHSEIDAVEADAALDMRDPNRSTHLLEKSLTTYEPRFARNRSLYLVRLARARLLDREVDGATDPLNSALELLNRDVASVRVGTELRLVIEQLEPHRSVRPVADLLARYRLSAYGAEA
jgi:transcriptional regulator with XRE-family HTH domain